MSNIQNLAKFGKYSIVERKGYVALNLVYLLDGSVGSRLFVLCLDPFADANQGDDKGLQDGLIHIRIQQRNGRKTLTTVQGIADSYDKKKIVKACKKVREFFHVSFVSGF